MLVVTYYMKYNLWSFFIILGKSKSIEERYKRNTSEKYSRLLKVGYFINLDLDFNVILMLWFILIDKKLIHFLPMRSLPGSKSLFVALLVGREKWIIEGDDILKSITRYSDGKVGKSHVQTMQNPRFYQLNPSFVLCCIVYTRYPP